MFQHGVADSGRELTAREWEVLTVRQRQRAIYLPDSCLPERRKPGVDAIHDFSIQHRPGKMPISRANVKNWLYQ